ncbi:MAG: rod shape-determining protein RodA [Candidatus Omnitrophota bacterium]|nr:MAG: rod shape-determining protein RodA [Candidatus Omnitrophota bacterium]
MRSSLKIVCVCLVILNILSMLSIYSSLHQAQEFKNQILFYKQIVWIVLGWIFLLIFSFINYRFYFDIGYFLYALNIILLLILEFTGEKIMGAKRWLSFLGVSFQPSEFSKLVLIIVLARIFSSETKKVFSKKILVPLFLVGLNFLFIFRQPDLGTALLCIYIYFFIGFASSLRKRYLVSLLLVGVLISPLGWHLLKDYQKKRLLVFLNPNIEPQGAGYTIIQSKIAIGSGRLWGKGFLSGTQNQFNFLPERHTDFIFTVIAEEEGFVGSLLLIIIYYLLLRHILAIAGKAKDEFGILLGKAITGLFFFQIFVNLGMCMGILPIVGIPLLFLSYGGTHLIINFIMIGIIFNISRKND